jgi:hypothetical protein
MQINSDNQGAQRASSSQKRPTIHGVGALGSATSPGPNSPIVRHDQVDISKVGQDLGDPKAEMTSQQRLDAWADKFLDRLDNLMQKDGLSRDQVAALQEAKDEFLTNIDRFSDVFIEGKGGRGVGSAMENLVGQLRDSVSDILGHPADAGGDSLGRAI